MIEDDIVLFNQRGCVSWRVERQGCLPPNCLQTIYQFGDLGFVLPFESYGKGGMNPSWIQEHEAITNTTITSSTLEELNWVIPQHQVGEVLLCKMGHFYVIVEEDWLYSISGLNWTIARGLLGAHATRWDYFFYKIYYFYYMNFVFSIVLIMLLIDDIIGLILSYICKFDLQEKLFIYEFFQ